MNVRYVLAGLVLTAALLATGCGTSRCCRPLGTTSAAPPCCPPGPHADPGAPPPGVQTLSNPPPIVNGHHR